MIVISPTIMYVNLSVCAEWKVSVRERKFHEPRERVVWNVDFEYSPMENSYSFPIITVYCEKRATTWKAWIDHLLYEFLAQQQQIFDLTIVKRELSSHFEEHGHDVLPAHPRYNVT